MQIEGPENAASRIDVAANASKAASKDDTAMSSRRQLQFMQSWGERRQQQILEKQQREEEQQGGANIGSSLTFVPRSAWQGLPDDATAPPADAGKRGGVSAKTPGFDGAASVSKGLVEPVEAPSAELARTDQLSEESAASVQSLCGGGSGGKPDADLGRQLRDPAEIAALLRHIRSGRRHMYAEDPYAMRLEQDIRIELNTELDRQSRMDAQLDSLDCLSSASAKSSEKVRVGDASPTHGSRPSDRQSDQRGSGQSDRRSAQKSTTVVQSDRQRRGDKLNDRISNIMSDRISNVKSDRTTEDRSTGSSGSGGLGGLASRLKLQQAPRVRVEPARTSAASNSRVRQTAAAWSTSCESSSCSSSDDSDPQMNKCRWRKSRLSSNSSNLGGTNFSNSIGSGKVAVGRRRARWCKLRLNRNCSNAQSSGCVAGCGLVLEDLTVEAGVDDDTEDCTSLACNSNAPPPPSPNAPNKANVDQKDGKRKPKVLVFDQNEKQPSAHAVAFAQEEPFKLDVDNMQVFEIDEKYKQRASRFNDTGARERRGSEQRRMQSQFIEHTPRVELDKRPKLSEMFAPGFSSDSDNHLRQSTKFFNDGPPVDEEAKRIVARRRNKSLGGSSSTDRESSIDLPDEPEPKSRAFMTGRHGRMSISNIKGFSNRPDIPPPPDDDVDSPDYYNQNSSNILSSRLGRLQQQAKMQEAEMLAMHSTEPHFTSEGVDKVGLTNANCCSDTQPSKRTMVRRRCRQVVLIHPQMVRWDLQLSQVVANPRARRLDTRDAGRFSSCSEEEPSEQQPSRMSLPTVTSRSAALLADGRYKPVGTGQIAHWVRLGNLAQVKRTTARVKRVGGRRGRHVRVAKVDGPERNISHCTEIVDNPSLNISETEPCGHLPSTAGASTTTNATAVTGDSSPCTVSTRDPTTSNTGTNCSSSAATDTEVSGASDTLALARYNRRRNARRCPERQDDVSELGDNCMVVTETANQKKLRTHAAGEAKPYVAVPKPEELTCLPSQTYLYCSNAKVVEGAQHEQHHHHRGDDTWLIAKRTRQPKSGYSHSVHYLPSITIPGSSAGKQRRTGGVSLSSAAAPSPAITTLLIACELTVMPSKQKTPAGKAGNPLPVRAV